MEKDEIITSWEVNAREWSRIVEQDGITSRQFTNPAIVEVIKEYEPLNILDLGCGEGWLTRELSNEKNKVTGVDATEALVNTARKKGPQNFFKISYDEIINGIDLSGAPFDAIVLNFCLYQNEEVSHLIKTLHKSLSNPAHIFIQTLHPSFLLLNGLPYEDQWIQDSWKGLRGNFVQPHSWYARTLETWVETFRDCRYKIIKVKEVTNNNKIPVSIIFILINEEN